MFNSEIRKEFRLIPSLTLTKALRWMNGQPDVELLKPFLESVLQLDEELTVLRSIFSILQLGNRRWTPMNADKTKPATVLADRSVLPWQVKPASHGKPFPICVDLRPSAVQLRNLGSMT